MHPGEASTHLSLVCCVSVCVCAGFVKTEMTREYWHEGAIEPSESVTGLLERAAGLSLRNTGSFWHKDGQLLPW